MGITPILIKVQNDYIAIKAKYAGLRVLGIKHSWVEKSDVVPRFTSSFDPFSLIILSLRRLGKASANHKISGRTENRGGSFGQKIESAKPAQLSQAG
jgi:hypothetical protein